MSIFRLSVAARFVLVLLIGLLFQAVISVVSLVDLKQSMLRDRTSEVKHLLEAGYSTLVYFHQQSLDGKLTEAQAKLAAAAVVRNMHYDAHNYYFIWDMQGNGIAHGGNSNFEGTNLLSGPDVEKYPGPSYMVKKLLDVARGAAKEGIARYKIPKAGQSIPLDKISYTRLFEPWGWSIGTGAYTDDIDSAFRERAVVLLAVFFALMLIAGIVTYYVVHDLVLAMRRLSLRITTLTNGELLGEIPDIERKDELGIMARALMVLRDTSKEVSELKLDHLTGLPTRKLLMDRIRQSKVRSTRSGLYNALILLDLDKFKPLNDTHGHDAGDKLLKEVAVRLTKAVRESDTVARLGGDEFVVLLVDLSADEHKAKEIATKISDKILSVLNQDYYLGHIVHHCTASLGMTLFIGKAIPADDLLKQADIAMYRSKVVGSEVCHFFEEENPDVSAEQNNFEKELSIGLLQQQFVLHYQPVVGIDEKIVGCEALIRWQHPTRGLLKPAQFLALAEKKGLTTPLGNLALEMACMQISAWAKKPELAELKVSVNIGAHHFRRAEFVDQLLAIIQRTRIHPGRLILELPEQVLANNIAIVIEKMMALRTLGIGFAIDDFGSSYSPLSHLPQLPIQELKICPAFVQHVFADTSSLATPKMILSLAQSLGLHAVAVGVETEAQQACLVQAGCTSFQGFLFCEPLSALDFEQFVQR